MSEHHEAAAVADAFRRDLIVDPLSLSEFPAEIRFAILAAWPPDRVYKLSVWHAIVGRQPDAEDWRVQMQRFPEGRPARASVLPRAKSARMIHFGRGLSLRFVDDHPAARPFMQRVLPKAGLHEPELIAHLCRTVRPGGMVVDVGAHVGYVSCVAAALGATVLAVELQPTLVPIIQLNAALNGLWAVHALCAAMSGSPGLISVPRVNPSPGLQNADDRDEGSIFPTSSLNHDLVPAITLDGLFAARPRPSLVKVDVEGAEGRVLAGARGLIQSGETSFVVEVHTHLIGRFGTSLEDLLAPFDADRWSMSRLTIDGPRPLSREAFLEQGRPSASAPTNLPVLFEPIRR